MKRFVCAVLVCVMVCAAAMAVEIDWKALTDEELIEIASGAQSEIDARNDASEPKDGVIRIEPGAVLMDEAGVKVTVASEFYEQFGMLVFDVVCENKSGHNVTVSAGDVYVNDWASMMSGYSESVEDGKKAKGMFLFMNIDDAGVKTVEDFESIECEIYAYDTDSWDDLTDKAKLNLMP